MNINEIKKLLEPYIDEPGIEFLIEKNLFSNESGRSNFNIKIKENVEPKKYGVYVWVDNSTGEVIYIGMAGKIKTDGSYGNHSIFNRLKASRGKDKKTKRDITTNDYVYNVMDANNIESMTFYIFYTKEGEPPSYIEAILLYNYYKRNRVLPRLNNSF